MDLTSNTSLDIRLDPVAVISRSGSGSAEVQIPTNVIEINITADYSGDAVILFSVSDPLSDDAALAYAYFGAGSTHLSVTTRVHHGSILLVSADSRVKWTITQVTSLPI